MSTAYSSEDMMAALKSDAFLLQQRRDVLTQLSNASLEMLSALQDEGSVDISPYLERREKQCASYADLCRKQTLSDEVLVSRAEKAAQSGERESAALAMMVLSMYADSQDLADSILSCQSDCEVILKTRLASTGQAIRASVHRRKLNAAYGPATRHDVPMFMDRQR